MGSANGARSRYEVVQRRQRFKIVRGWSNSRYKPFAIRAAFAMQRKLFSYPKTSRSSGKVVSEREREREKEKVIIKNGHNDRKERVL